MDSSRVDGTMEVDRHSYTGPASKPTRRRLASVVQQAIDIYLGSAPVRPTAWEDTTVRSGAPWRRARCRALLCSAQRHVARGPKPRHCEKSTLGAGPAPGVWSSNYSRAPLPSSLAVNP